MVMSSSAKLAREGGALRNTYCSRGHAHPPWNTTGVLRIAKCESVCGFCQKETKTAANLRKHVAIHIKNEGLNLTIAEGSSGRGRLEIPPTELSRHHSPPNSQMGLPVSQSQQQSSELSFSAPAVLLSISHPHLNPRQTSPPSMTSVHSQQQSQTLPSISPYQQQQQSQLPHPNTLSLLPHPQPQPNFYQPPPSNFTPLHTPTHPPPHPISASSTPSPIIAAPNLARFHPQDVLTPEQLSSAGPAPDVRSIRHQKDPFWALRAHNLTTKIAWTAIPASEGFKILDYCKRNSVITSAAESSSSGGQPSSGAGMSSSGIGSSSSGIGSSSSASGGMGLGGNVMGVGNVMGGVGMGGRSGVDNMGGGGEGMEGVERVPCYNRKVLFDEEWQAHMRDVHGVFLLWPETWMRRIEVLDLEPFGGDIGVCNDVIMAA